MKQCIFCDGELSTVESEGETCDNCWEVSSRIGAMAPGTIRKIVQAHGRDLAQETIERLVQWDAFQKIWGESTPRQKQYVREALKAAA